MNPLFLIGIFSKVKDFIIDNWRICLLLVILTYTYYEFHAIQRERDTAVSVLNDYKRSVNDAIIKRREDNAEKEAKANANILALAASHNAIIDKLRSEYEAKNHTHFNSNDAFNDSLRDRIAKAADRLRYIPNAKQEPSESGNDSDATITRQDEDAIGTGCAIVTEQYNTLYNEWISACNVYGCK